MSDPSEPRAEGLAAADLRVPVTRLAHARDLPLPRYATPGAAGVDLHAALDEELVVRRGAIARVPTGLALAIPPGFEGQVRPRSGLAARHGLTVVNAPGTIDSDYRGEVCVLLTSLIDAPFTLHRGDRIAQLLFTPVARAALVEVEDLDRTARGAGGFGHTGTTTR